MPVDSSYSISLISSFPYRYGWTTSAIIATFLNALHLLSLGLLSDSIPFFRWILYNNEYESDLFDVCPSLVERLWGYCWIYFEKNNGNMSSRVRTIFPRPFIYPSISVLLSSPQRALYINPAVYGTRIAEPTSVNTGFLSEYHLNCFAIASYISSGDSASGWKSYLWV